MNKLYSLLASLVLLAVTHGAFAAVTQADNNIAGSNSIAVDSATTVGDLILVGLQGGTDAENQTVSDNVDSGNYIQIGTSFSYEAGANFLTLYYKIVTTAGTPTITATGGDRIAFSRWTGFSVGAYVATSTNYATATATSATITASFNASFNSEYAWGILSAFGASNNPPTFSGQFAQDGMMLGSDAFEAGNVSTSVSSGTTVTLTAANGSSVNWAALTIGFYDGTGGTSCTHDGWVKSTGAWAVPISGSTVVWLQSGAFGTVNCTSTSYYQQTTGAFGTS